MGGLVGRLDGLYVGLLLVGEAVGLPEGPFVVEGEVVGFSEGASVSESEGLLEGDVVGTLVGACDDALVEGESVSVGGVLLDHIWVFGFGAGTDHICVCCAGAGAGTAGFFSCGVVATGSSSSL